MTHLRISRIVGFGAKPPLDFATSPVTLGTAAGSSIKFDAGFDRGVGPRHATIEWNGEAWYFLDGGTAEGSWVDGKRLTEAHLLEGATEISLGERGPKVRVETIATASPMSVPVPQAPVQKIQAEISTAKPQAENPPGRARLAVLAVALVLVGVAIMLFIVTRGDKRPGFDGVLTVAEQEEVSLPAQEMEEDPRPPEPETVQTQPSETPVPATQQTQVNEAPTIPDSLRPAVEELKKNAFYQALIEFWTQTPSRSPYVKALLKNEDLWLATQLPWLQRYQDSGGSSTGRGMDFPGAFVPEAIYPDAEMLGIPAGSPDVSAVIENGLAEHPPSGDGGRVATMASSPSVKQILQASRPPSKSRLESRFRTYAAGDSARSTESPKAYGLFVGINGFEDPGANLVGCRNDVGAIAKVLGTQGIFTANSIRMLTDTRKNTPDFPSKSNVINALRETVAKAGPNDILFLSFSTHGMYDPNAKDSCLLMADMGMLYGKEMSEILSAAKAKNIVITMDACQTGGMTAIGSSQFSAKAKASPIPESFYEMLGSSRGHVVIRACRADQSTPDIRALGQGLLCSVLLSGLTGDADANGDGIVTLSELRIYATTAIPSISKRAIELGSQMSEDPLQATFTSSSFGEAGDLPLTVVEPKAN